MNALSKLSRLTQLRQFSFDALVLDDAEHVALFDNAVIRWGWGGVCWVGGEWRVFHVAALFRG
jgi:hypothetical protein